MAQLDTFKSTGRMPVGAPAARQQSYTDPELSAQAQTYYAASQLAFGVAKWVSGKEKDNQLAEFEGAVTERYNAFSAERSIDSEPATYIDKFDEFIKSVKTTEYPNLKMSSAKREADIWLKDKSAQWQGQILGMATRRTIQNTKDAIALNKFRAIKNRDADLINNTVDRAVASGAYSKDAGDLIKEETHYEILLALIEDNAREAINAARESGKDIEEALGEGIEVVRSFDDEVKNLSDLNAISNRIEKDFLLMLTGEFTRLEQTRAEERVKADSVLLDPQASTADMDQATKSLDSEEQDRYKNAQIARVKEGPPSTDDTAFNQHINNILDYYENPKDSDAEELIRNDYLDRKLSDNDKDSLIGWMGQHYPADIIVGLREAVSHSKTIKKVLQAEGKDQRRIASYNRALFEWLNNNIDKEKNKYPTAEEIHGKSRILANFYKYTDDTEFQPLKLTPKKKDKQQTEEITGTYGEEIKESPEKDITELTDEELDAEIEKLKKKK
jgi:hypothetical protein